MNCKLLFSIFIFGGAALSVQAQTTPDLEAVTTQGNSTTNSITVRNLEGIRIVTDPLNMTVGTHTLRPSPVDPGVMRFDCGSNTVLSGWEFYNSLTNKSLMYIRQNTGAIGIGTPNPKTRLAVNGEMLAKKVRVTGKDWADYVFESSYQLPSLQEVEHFIAKHKHLPDVPSAKEVISDDLYLGQNLTVLLKKVEEMTLYLIAQDKKLNAYEQRINDRKQMLADREKLLSELEAMVGNK
ncbi:hypothetical protein [Chitinophaga sp. S165]|uniref:hypothetical protein n=1 Tax=Chitinophaga sp. S165 TaxID=2135462 RepID=UPI000D996583|nr:hypothetical protein [Chitinophaga sp. S165]PWV56699.1 hypothetical protein C7475_1011216 [Chitinophaga sp. S165]